METLTLSTLPGTFSIHRCASETPIPSAVTNASFFSIAKTSEELSIVVPGDVSIQSDSVDKGWGCFKVHGPLDFSLTGILAMLSGILAKAGLSIFAISTFDTDYILVKKENMELAGQALSESGCEVLYSEAP